MRKFPSGFYLNLKSKKFALLHTCRCKHYWQSEEEKGKHVMLSNTKACCASVVGLARWARENNISVICCKDCAAELQVDFAQKHYLVYHNETRWGNRRGLGWIDTNKSVDDLVGHRIWLVSGLRKMRRYYLVSTFVVDGVGHQRRKGWKNWASGSREQAFIPPIRLDGFKWFAGFKKHFGNFGLGLQPITGNPYITTFESFRKNPDRYAEQFKPTADPRELEERTRELLRLPLKTAPAGHLKPKMVLIQTHGYQRDAQVIAYVLQQSKDKCELCKKPGPFAGEDGTPFLEVHHVKPLADEGSDTAKNAVAVCPNCHRSLHHASDAERRREKLYRQVKRLVRE